MSLRLPDIVRLQSLISGGFVNNAGRHVVRVQVCVWTSKCVFTCVRVVVCVFESDTTPQWSMALCTEFLISGGIHTFQTLLCVFIYLSNYLFIYLLLTTIRLDERLYFEAFLFWTENDAKL